MMAYGTVSYSWVSGFGGKDVIRQPGIDFPFET